MPRHYHWTAIYLRHPLSAFVRHTIAAAARRLAW